MLPGAGFRDGLHRPVLVARFRAGYQAGPGDAGGRAGRLTYRRDAGDTRPGRRTGQVARRCALPGAVLGGDHTRSHQSGRRGAGPADEPRGTNVMLATSELGPKYSTITWDWAAGIPGLSGGEASYDGTSPDQVVQTIQLFNAVYRLVDVMGSYGEPSDVVARVLNSPDQNDPASYDINLIYHERASSFSPAGRTSRGRPQTWICG